MACWATAFKPGSGEDVLDAARAAAEDLFALVSNALEADRSAGGSVVAPGRIVVVGGGLEESPDNWQGTAGWRAERSFSLSWTSHS
jgi:hypothetical protein